MSDKANSTLPAPSIPTGAVLTELLQLCLAHLNDAVLITEAEPWHRPGPRIVWANDVFYTQTGYCQAEVIGQSPRLLQGPGTDKAALRRIRVALENWQPIRETVLNYRKDGSAYWNEFEVVPIANAQGWYTHWVSVQRDVTESKVLEAELVRLTQVDVLTGCNNRRYFLEQMDKEILRAKRYDRTLSLLMLDIDFFKHVNDTHGHQAGDQVLKSIAGTMAKNARELDTLARIGGEEFAIILPETDNQGAVDLAERLRNAIETTRHVLETGVGLQITVSIGAASLATVDLTTDGLLKAADIAMYQAKIGGRNMVCTNASREC
jgi:diguanylate cyclase (GGDEF)-like protein/PAS domain S-box-containing protein